MKVILKEEYPTKEILVDDITEEHLVVAIIRGRPCVLGKQYDQSFENLCFFILGSNGSPIITIGNGFNGGYNKENNIQHIIKHQLKKGAKIEAFKKEDWKKALLWLINNG